MKNRLSFIRNRAFTLIELLTVIAITAIILTIIVVPMIQSFNTVRSAQAFSDAQEKARIVLERISREISNSAGVRDNSGVLGTCDVVVPAFDYATTGNLVTVPLQYTKLDVVKPAQEGPVSPTGAPINPGTHKIDPTMHSQKGQIMLPVAPGATFVRYWIGLRSPLVPPLATRPNVTPQNFWQPDRYYNPYDGLLMARGGGRDNLYVLLRAEVQPWINVNGVLKVNTDFFDVDSGGNPIIDDPDFYIYHPQNLQNPTAADLAQLHRIGKWLGKATIVTEVSRYDMISPIYDKVSRVVAHDGNVPRLLPLVQFKPARVGSEPAAGMQTARLGVESDGMQQFASDVFKTKLGGWSNTVVRVYPLGWTGGQPLLVARSGGTTDDVNYNVDDVSVFYYDPAAYPGDQQLSSGFPMFDVTKYENDVAAGGVFSFSDALVAEGIATAAQRSNFIPFSVDTRLGKIVASFGIWEVGANPPNPPAGNPNNLPYKDCGSQQTPSSKLVLPGGIELYKDHINDQFNKIWLDHPELRQNLQRFIDLRITPQGDGTPSPLNPDPTIGFPRATIVPGSEVVYGPDQRSENFGRTDSNGNPIVVRYTRTTGDPGINQYRINYVNLPEPTNPATGLVDYSLLGLPNPPANYDPTNYVSAIIQPRYKVGYIQLNSEATAELPPGGISVQYRFQFTQQTVQHNVTAAGDTLTTQSDSMTVDYDSRQVMTLLLTIKNFPQTSEPNPQGITLKATANVRNFLR